MCKAQIILGLILSITSLLKADGCDANHYEAFQVRIHDHLFDPDVIVVPPDTIIKLVFENQDDEAEEIFSHPLKLKKIIFGHSQGFVFIGPLEQGDYALKGRFFSRSAVGVVRVIRL